MTRLLLVVAVVTAAACGDDAADVLPWTADYADTFVEVRDCRRSGDHNLHYMRVLADPAAAAVYTDRDAPFAEGAIVLKEEYDFADTACEGEIVRWTVMERLPEGSAPDTLDWHWLDVDGDRQILSEDLPSCVGCHQACTPPDGYLGTCTVP